MKSKYIIIGIVLLPILYLFHNYNPEISHFFPRCPFHSTTGLYCPGCGSQRALHQLLHFNFIEMMKYNALFIIGIGTILYNISIKTLNKLTPKNYYNYLYHPKTPLFLLIMVSLFWILRNIPYSPFTYLAPH